MSIEMLISFMLSLALISALYASLQNEAHEISARRGEYEGALKAESSARAAEALMYAGFSDIGSAEGVFRPISANPSGPAATEYRIEDGVLHAEHLGKMVEIRGVFIYDGAEPA